MIVSAYDNNDKIVEGKYNNGYVLNERNGIRYKFSDLRYARFVEDVSSSDDERNDDVLNKVEADINMLDSEKLKNTPDDTLEKAGEQREKELRDAGLKIDDNQYKNAFVVAAKSKGAMDDVNKGDINNSQALSKLLASHKFSDIMKARRIQENDDENLILDYYYSQLDPDYHDVPLYDDSMQSKEDEDEESSEKSHGVSLKKDDENVLEMDSFFRESIFKRVYEEAHS